ncbi:MAG: hypothetical protein L0214_06815 [candidate division NC10 bacterium]|nr:hypothetical protein [candidate division NC10 bacterium]
MRLSFLVLCAGVLVLLVAGGFALPGAASAARLGDPASVAAPTRFTLGVEYEFIERDVEFDSPIAPGNEAELESQRIFVRGAYGLVPNLEVFVRLGGAEAETDTPSVNGDFGLAFGGGVKGVIYRGPNWALGAVGQFLYYKSENGGEIEVLEFDLAAGASFALGPVTPYAGLVLQLTQGELTSPAGSSDFDQDNLIGVFFGMNYVPQPNISLGIEAHLIHETAVSLVLEARF